MRPDRAVSDPFQYIEIYKLTTACDEVSEPGDNNGRAVRALQEREHREYHDHAKAVKRNALARAIGEESRSSAFECESVQCANGAVCVGVASRKDRSQHEAGNFVNHLDREVVVAICKLTR